MYISSICFYEKNDAYSKLLMLPNLVHSKNHWSKAQTQFHIYTSFFFFGGRGRGAWPPLPYCESVPDPTIRFSKNEFNNKLLCGVSATSLGEGFSSRSL